MRKVLSLLLVACMMLALTACASSQPAPATEAGKVYKVGICPSWCSTRRWTPLPRASWISSRSCWAKAT